jgi:MerC mercury resistance protein
MPVSRYIDHIAIGLSAVCIVHCLAVPLVVALLPIALVAFPAEDHFHALLLWFVVPTSLVGLVLGVRLHRRKEIVAVGMVGMILIAVSALVGHGVWAYWIEIGVSLVGSFTLALAHWHNFKEVRRCHHHVARS